MSDAATVQPGRELQFLDADISVERRSDSSMVLRSAGLADLNKGVSGASQRVTRAIIMRQPPSFDSGEITEKGSLNARLIRERRADLVEALYSDSHPDVLKVP
jgi:hypothetical protein